MSSFQAKIGWKRQREKENKNYRFVPFLPDCLEKIQKNSKKFKKFLNMIMVLFQAKNRLEKAENERK